MRIEQSDSSLLKAALLWLSARGGVNPIKAGNRSRFGVTAEAGFSLSESVIRQKASGVEPTPAVRNGSVASGKIQCLRENQIAGRMAWPAKLRTGRRLCEIHNPFPKGIMAATPIC